jgi:hypothetical protein
MSPTTRHAGETAARRLADSAGLLLNKTLLSLVSLCDELRKREGLSQGVTFKTGFRDGENLELWFQSSKVFFPSSDRSSRLVRFGGRLNENLLGFAVCEDELKYNQHFKTLMRHHFLKNWYFVL